MSDLQMARPSVSSLGFAAVVAAAALALPTVAFADPTPPSNADIEARLKALADENDALRARVDRLEADQKAASSNHDTASGAEGTKDSVDLVQMLRPTVLAELDYRVYPSDKEGNTGFSIGRLRSGLVFEPAKWMKAFVNVEFAEGEGPEILDGWVKLKPTDWFNITLGYSKPPLFPSAFYEPEHTGAFPDVSTVVSAFRIRRDLGVGFHFWPKSAPIEADLRIGNGSGSALGNDNALPAGYASLDLVLGRAWVGSTGRAFGLRLGASGLVENAFDRDGVKGVTPLGFVYARPIVVSGLRLVGESHLWSYLGPVRIGVEAAIAQEGRSKDDDGNPKTPRIDRPSIRSTGLTAEADLTAIGRPREVGEAPRAADGEWRGGALEIAARYDGLWLNQGVAEVPENGSQGGAFGVKWWPTEYLAASASWNFVHYDVAPIEEPAQRWSWGILTRASFFWGFEK